MTRHSSIVASASMLALVLLLPACVQQSALAGTAAFDAYSHGFAASQPKSISSVLEVTAPRMENRSSEMVHVSGTDGTRAVRVRMLDADQWKDVHAVWIRAGAKEIAPETLAALLSEGVAAREADIKVKGGTVIVRLSDVLLPTHDAPAEWVSVTLDFGARSSSARHLVATMNSSMNHVPGIGFVGGD